MSGFVGVMCYVWYNMTTRGKKAKILGNQVPFLEALLPYYPHLDRMDQVRLVNVILLQDLD